MAATARARSRCPICAAAFPIHQGNGFILAETGGAEEITLTTQQIPAHTHALLASNDIAESANSRQQASSAQIGPVNTFYQDAGPSVPWRRNAIGPVGGSQPHTNFQPYLCVDFIISLFGIFPSPT